MPPPYKPMSLKEHRLRYPQAISRLYFIEDIERGGERPGQNLDNIFDFSDGMRLIISRDHHDTEGTVLHASASPKEGSQWSERLSRHRTLHSAMGDWVRGVKKRLKDLTDLDWHLEFISPEKGVAHFFLA